MDSESFGYSDSDSDWETSLPEGSQNAVCDCPGTTSSSAFSYATSICPTCLLPRRQFVPSSESDSDSSTSDGVVSEDTPPALSGGNLTCPMGKSRSAVYSSTVTPVVERPAVVTTTARQRRERRHRVTPVVERPAVFTTKGRRRRKRRHTVIPVVESPAVVATTERRRRKRRHRVTATVSGEHRRVESNSGSAACESTAPFTVTDVVERPAVVTTGQQRLKRRRTVTPVVERPAVVTTERRRRKRRNVETATVSAEHQPVKRKSPLPADKDGRHSEGTTVCAICHKTVEDCQKSDRTPCEHIFHEYCFSRWLEENSMCPMCRRDVTGYGIPTEALDEDLRLLFYRHFTTENNGHLMGGAYAGNMPYVRVAIPMLFVHTRLDVLRIMLPFHDIPVYLFPPREYDLIHSTVGRLVGRIDRLMDSLSRHATDRDLIDESSSRAVCTTTSSCTVLRELLEEDSTVTVTAEEAAVIIQRSWEILCTVRTFLIILPDPLQTFTPPLSVNRFISNLNALRVLMEGLYRFLHFNRFIL